MAVERIKVAPEVVSYTDDEHSRLTVEISIPGVKKEDIKVKLHDDSLYLAAPRDDIEYVTTLAFCCPVSPNKAEAHYENGLLKVEVPFRDPMEGAVSLEVS